MEPDAPQVHDGGNLVSELHSGRGDLIAPMPGGAFGGKHEIPVQGYLALARPERVGRVAKYQRGRGGGHPRRWGELHRSGPVSIGPAVVQASRQIGGAQIQNVGTLAGNLVNGSPAADAVPPPVVLYALAVLRSVQGKRGVPVVELATGPGQMSIAPDEILTQVVIPKPKAHMDGDGKEVAFFDKLGPRKAQTIAIASVALRGWLGGEQCRLMDVRVALGAVAPTVMLASRTAACLMGGPLTEERILEGG